MHRDSDVDNSELIKKSPIINYLNFKTVKWMELKGTKTEVQHATHLDSLWRAHKKARNKHG